MRDPLVVRLGRHHKNKTGLRGGSQESDGRSERGLHLERGAVLRHPALGTRSQLNTRRTAHGCGWTMAQSLADVAVSPADCCGFTGITALPAGQLFPSNTLAWKLHCAGGRISVRRMP